MFPMTTIRATTRMMHKYEVDVDLLIQSWKERNQLLKLSD